jgi:N-acetylglucosamine-6-phosphate deacetylase
MVPGYHLEGPFLNAAEGYRGCHPEQAMRDPDATLYDRLGDGLARPILLVTLAPERPGSSEAIRQLRSRGICVAMAHSAASYPQVVEAADAGLTLSTHLGNGMPRIVHRTDNALLAQLAEDRLAACVIADGHHQSPDALAAIMRIKGVERTILATDAVLAAAAVPGRYVFADMDIELGADGMVRRPGQDNLAGSSLQLDAAVRNIVAWHLATPEQAIRMASTQPRAAIAEAAAAQGVSLPVGTIRWSDDLRPLEVTF